MLVRQNALENYTTDLVDEVATNLIRASGLWSGNQTNRPYNADLVNIYLIDSQQLPEDDRNILEAYGIALNYSSIKGNALTDEETKSIFVDTRFLKEIVALNQLYWDHSIPTHQAVAAVEVRGLSSFQHLWDPSINPKLRSRARGEKWLISYRGTLAFILGHEMGHIYLGRQDFAKKAKPIKLKSKRDRDRYWACPELVDPRFKYQREIETQADDFAGRLIEQIFFPSGTFEKPRFLYELGTYWYLQYALGKSYIHAMYTVQSSDIKEFLRNRYGSALYMALMEKQRVLRHKGPISVFYPKTHPSSLRRLAGLLGALSESRYSFYYGEAPDPLFAVWERRIARECEALETE